MRSVLYVALLLILTGCSAFYAKPTGEPVRYHSDITIKVSDVIKPPYQAKALHGDKCFILISPEHVTPDCIAHEVWHCFYGDWHDTPVSC